MARGLVSNPDLAPVPGRALNVGHLSIRGALDRNECQASSR